MNSRTHQSSSGAAKPRVEVGLEVHRVESAPRVARHMLDRFGPNPRHCASRAHPDDSRGDLNTCAPLKAVIDQSNDLVLHVTGMRKARRFVSLGSVSCNIGTHEAVDGGTSFPPTCRYSCNQLPEATRSSV